MSSPLLSGYRALLKSPLAQDFTLNGTTLRGFFEWVEGQYNGKQLMLKTATDDTLTLSGTDTIVFKGVSYTAVGWEDDPQGIEKTIILGVAI